MASSALYFTQVVHLPTGLVGTGLAIAGVIGLLAGVPIGDLADRRGPRDVFAAALLVQAATMASFVLIHSFAVFLCLDEPRHAGRRRRRLGARSRHAPHRR